MITDRSNTYSHLRKHLDEISSSGRISVVLISGEEGVGKSAVVAEVLKECEVAVCVGRVRDGGPAFEPVARALRQCVQGLPDGIDSCGSNGRFLGLLLPEIDAPDERPGSELLADAVGDAFHNRSLHGPLVVFFDDLHRADFATLELLPRLVERLRDSRVMVVGTYRDDEIGRSHPLRKLRNELRRLDCLQEIKAQPLSREQTRSLVSELLEGDVGRDLLDLLYEKTRGNPLYVQETVRALQESQGVTSGEHGFVLTPGLSLPVPESVRDAVLLRLDSLSEAALETLEFAAVLGDEFQLDHLHELTGDDDALDELFRSGVIAEEAGGCGAFRHGLIREIIVREITWSRRRKLHRQVGEFLEGRGATPETVAEHWLAARENERARAALIASAERACSVHAYSDAARAANRALDIWPENDNEADRIATLERYANCAQISGQLTEAIRAWKELLASEYLASDAARRAEICRSLSATYGVMGKWSQAIELRKQASEALRESGNIGEAALEMLLAASRLTGTLQLTDAAHCARQAAKLAEASGRSDVLSRALGLEGNVMAMQGEFDAGRQTVERGLTVALEHNETEAAAEVYRRLASAHEYSSDYVAATQAYATALDFCRSQGADSHAHVCLGCMSATLFQVGDWTRAIKVSREVLDIESSPPGSKAVAEGMLALIHLYRGEPKHARKHLKSAGEIARALQIAAIELLDLWGQGELYTLEDESEKARDAYERLLARWEETQDRHDAIPAITTAASFFADRGLTAQANLCSKAMASIASATGSPEALASLAFTLGEVAISEQNFDLAVSEFEQALNHFAKVEIPADRCRAEYRAGLANAEAGKLGTAASLLQSSYRSAKKMGMRPLAARIADIAEHYEINLSETRSEGAPDRALKAGLTRRQMEILKLMSDGLTNKEIAEQLFLSPRTVDMHVSNVLARLDCRTRAEAVKVAGDLDLL